MRVTTAYVCLSGQEVFDRAPAGTCPVCRSEHSQALAWLLAAPHVRETWVAKSYSRRDQGAGRGLRSLP